MSCIFIKYFCSWWFLKNIFWRAIRSILIFFFFIFFHKEFFWNVTVNWFLFIICRNFLEYLNIFRPFRNMNLLKIYIFLKGLAGRVLYKILLDCGFLKNIFWRTINFFFLFYIYIFVFFKNIFFEYLFSGILFIICRDLFIICRDFRDYPHLYNFFRSFRNWNFFKKIAEKNFFSFAFFQKEIFLKIQE